MTTSGLVDLRTMVTVLQASRFAQRDQETIKRWLRSGLLPGKKVGLVWYIDLADLRSFLGDS